ncbi:hypothetical protein [Tritonibacter mobilis]|uniref:hypothetical protein n=1 Tax=Tritonibacter mobilis TaxID=379347 RepID=UPI001402EEBF|nr:hypothetical protein [Tritonibacter mobilis]NHM19869.1 hypothetical protein [Tritonibacter mobilis]NHM24050.1 hypothetical protein [Tritonibacter mobilis]
MIEFRTLSDDNPALRLSPLLRAALRTMEYAAEHNGIGLTATKAFQRKFVHWAVEYVDWPGYGPEEAFSFSKVVNEYEFPPIQIVHFLLLQRKLGHHYKGKFLLTRKGEDLLTTPGVLFGELIPFFLLEVDHTSYGRLDERPFGTWDVWLNVMNVELVQGLTERQLYGLFYGEGPDWDNAGWRELAAFSSYVLTPLEWAGLVSVHEVEGSSRRDWMYCKTPLWGGAMRLETDEMVKVAVRH